MGSVPAAVRRITTARPASTKMVVLPAFTKVAGPPRFGSGIGLPVPSRVMSMFSPFGAGSIDNLANYLHTL